MTKENRHAKITLLQDRRIVHGKKQPTFLLIPIRKQVICQLSYYTNKKNVRTEQRKITESDDV